MTYNNPFLQFAIAVKREYKAEFGEVSYDYEARRNGTCLNAWVERLNVSRYNSLLSGLSLHQYEEFIVAHYSEYFKAVDELGREVQYKDFFYVHDSFYRDCRGVMIDIENENLVLLPFKKFFNLGEMPETSLDNIRSWIENAHCVEFSDKLDGSMISVGMYNDEIVSSGSNCNNPDISRQLKNSISYIINHDNYAGLVSSHPDDTFIFEHIFPSIDPHVVQYKTEGLYLVGIRNRLSGIEYSYKTVIEMAEKYNVLHTDVFSVTLDDVLSSLGSKPATEAEGFVLSIDGYKVKIKYDDYVEIHKTLMGTLSYKTVIKAMCEGTVDDYLAKIPESYRGDFISKVQDVNREVNIIDSVVRGYLTRVPSGDVKLAMQWVSETVPKKYQAYVRAGYLGKDIDYLRKGKSGYRTFAELQELACS